jgi:hypothetical protein
MQAIVSLYSAGKLVPQPANGQDQLIAAMIDQVMKQLELARSKDSRLAIPDHFRTATRCSSASNSSATCAVSALEALEIALAKGVRWGQGLG